MRLTKRLDDGQVALDCKNCELNSLQQCTALACRNRLKNRLAEYEEAPTIYPKDLLPHGRWEWREKWDIDEQNHNSTLEYCGWYCTNCGIELGKYMTERTGEQHYLDDDFRKPMINCCPCCGCVMDLEEQP